MAPSILVDPVDVGGAVAAIVKSIEVEMEVEKMYPGRGTVGKVNVRGI